MSDAKTPLWYLSFASDAGTFWGGYVTSAWSFEEALRNVHASGAKPEGECLGFCIPEEERPKDFYRDRRLSTTEIRELWPDAASLQDHDARERGAS